jgi:hypothetical protein
MLVHDRMALATGQQPAVDREGDGPDDQQRARKASQKRKESKPASMAPGMRSIAALSTISMMVMLGVSMQA